MGITQKRWFPVAFFLGGFLYDVLSISPIDSVFQILKQAAYLMITAGLLYMEILETYAWDWKTLFRNPAYVAKLEKAFSYREAALQFLFGALLSEYTIFYFKSASLFTSFAFVILMSVIMLLNEFVRFKRYKVALHLGIFTLCLATFWLYLVPIGVGFIGMLPFALSMLVTAICLLAGFRSLTRHRPESVSLLKRQLAPPSFGVIAGIVLLYAFQLIPPLPLSLTYIGIFHEVRKENGDYVLSHQKPSWRFWERGDQDFHARPGDKIYAFVSVFSPARFKDELRVRWLYRTPRGWEPQDAIPFSVSGGREEGYRGFTVKANYVPGRWRVRIETTDGREIGRVNLTVTEDPSTENRVYWEERR